VVPKQGSSERLTNLLPFV